MAKQIAEIPHLKYDLGMYVYALKMTKGVTFKSHL